MSGVRPTKRCLNDLGVPFPPLDIPLHEVKHDLVAKAQRFPKEYGSGGAERVLSISDRLWFKVKIGEYHGASGQVTVYPSDQRRSQQSWRTRSAAISSPAARMRIQRLVRTHA